MLPTFWRRNRPDRNQRAQQNKRFQQRVIGAKGQQDTRHRIFDPKPRHKHGNDFRQASIRFDSKNRCCQHDGKSADQQRGTGADSGMRRNRHNRVACRRKLRPGEDQQDPGHAGADRELGQCDVHRIEHQPGDTDEVSHHDEERDCGKCVTHEQRHRRGAEDHRAKQ